MNAHPNDGGPAFPMPIAGCNDGSVYNTLEQWGGELGGMSLRDYLAAKAMQGLMAMCATGAQTLNGADNCARLAYMQADAMLRAREAQS